MDTILAQTLCESSITEDRSRFEMTFVDAGGERHKISIPFTIAADLIPVFETLAGDRNAGEEEAPAAEVVGDGGVGGRNAGGADFTRLPREFAVGHAIAEHMVLLRFDKEAPYAIGIEAAEALGRELQEQSERVSLMRRPAMH